MVKKIISLFMGVTLLMSSLLPAVKPLTAFADVGNVNGLDAKYYTIDQSTYALTTLKAETIDTKLNSSDLLSDLQNMTGTASYAGIRYTGEIEAPVTGTYSFHYFGDNGIRLYINGQNLIDHWANDWNTDVYSTVTVSMTAGQKYDFQMDYFNATGGANISLKWSAKDADKQTVLPEQPIPDNAFYLGSNYDGPMVTGLDTSAASLVYQNISGTIDITGYGLSDTKIELLDFRGAEFTPARYLKPVSETATDVRVAVPTTLDANMYTLVITKGVCKVKSPTFFVTYDYSKTGVRSEYPRPDWARSQWESLNGEWSFDFDPNVQGDTANWQTTHAFTQKICVPFCWESALSGIGNRDYLGVAWYQRSFTLDSSWANKQVILNFGAVDWRCKIWVNGQLASTHEGGYNAFEVNVTPYLNPVGQSNSIVVRVEDYDQNNPNPSLRNQLIGKQGYDAPCGYTPTSGIWQSVYLVARSSATCISYAHANPDIDHSAVTFNMDVYNGGNAGDTYTLSYTFAGTLNDKSNGSGFSGSRTVVLSKTGDNTFDLTAAIPDQKLWDLQNPNLYGGTFTLTRNNTTADSVSTYFGQRKISTQAYGSNTTQYIYLNNKPVYLSGLLDQGFWENGIYTAPTADAIEQDVQNAKNDGFNLLRLHIKIEDPLKYYYADKLGMLIWQDMPWGQNFNATDSQPDIGRPSYESALQSEMNRDYNHPSMIAIILFNETWGINYNAGTYNGQVSTVDWISSLYAMVKAAHPGMLCEDMSAYNKGHIEPTDQVSFHYYANSTSELHSFIDPIDQMAAGSDPGDYNGQPILNGEYGGGGTGANDSDVSWCFKYQTDILRLDPFLCGFVYTQPYDVEFERNGLSNADRSAKDLGYGDIAYGGDMDINDLTQPNYIGFYNQPVVTLKPGNTYTAQMGLRNWSGNIYSGLKLCYRLDGTDQYGNDISTGISGSIPVDYTPFTLVRQNFSFQLPSTKKFSKFVGTLTAWLQTTDGKTIAKNFTNIITGSDSTVQPVTSCGTDGYALRDAAVTTPSGSVSYSYTVPAGFDASSLSTIRVLAEASSYKPGASETSSTEQAPSDVTVSINGHEFQTVTLPDNPRDMRGTLSLQNNQSSAGNYGYLINIAVPRDICSALRSELASNKTLTVKYEIKNTAANQNQMVFYPSTAGRYAVDPTLLLNGDELSADDRTGSGNIQLISSFGTGGNYSVEGDVAAAGSNGDTAGFVVRAQSENAGYFVSVRRDGTAVSLSKLDGTAIKTASGLALGTGKHHLKITLFDAHIRVYVDNGVVPVLDTYDSTYTAGQAGILDSAGGSTFSNLDKTQETYGFSDGTDSGSVTDDQALLSLGDTTTVSTNLYLPAEGDNGSRITWATSNANVVSDTGVITRPAAGSGDASATLTATITKGTVSAVKTFKVTVVEASSLVAHYKFLHDRNTGVLKDSAGNKDGRYSSGVTFGTDPAHGGTMVLDGSGQTYGKLPDGLLGSLDKMTVATWVYCTSDAVWQRIFDFGSGTDSYIMVSANSGNGDCAGKIMASIKNPGQNGGAEQVIAGSRALPLNTWHNVALTMNGGTGCLYLDGQLIGASTSLQTKPSDLTYTTQNYLGKSQWPDPQLNGMLADFRVYDTALSVGEIQSLMNVVPTAGVTLNTDAVSLNIGNTARLTAAVTPLGQTNTVEWMTDNPDVATVAQDGTVTARGSGTAIITAVCDGERAYSPVTVLRFQAALSNTTGFVTGLQPGTTAADVEQSLIAGGVIPSDAQISVQSNGTPLAPDDMVGTGMVVTVNGTAYTAVVFGDLNGDSKLGASDLLALKRYVLGIQSLNPVQKAAANVSHDTGGLVNATDLLVLKRAILGISVIDQAS